MNTVLRPGFVYTVETIDRHGNVLDVERIHNLMPTEGLNHLIATEFKGGTQVATWYIGLYEGNYTPTASDTAATFPALATECVAYDESTRVEFVDGAVSSGAMDNSASRAEFTFNADKTVYGGFISSAAAKSATSGVLSSVVRFSSPKQPGDGGVLRVTAGFEFLSA